MIKHDFRISPDVGEGRKFGVEIEAVYARALNVPPWGLTREGEGIEFVSPPLQGINGLNTVRNLYALAYPVFDDSCGVHVHIDIRDHNDHERLNLVRQFVATKQHWFDYVDPKRLRNRYCYNDLPEVKGTWQDYYSQFIMYHPADRYYWLNLYSIRKYGTIEMRLHEATINVEKVIVWIRTLVEFVTKVKNNEDYTDLFWFYNLVR